MTQMFYRTLISSCSNSYSSVPGTATYAYGSHCKFWFCWQLYKVRPSIPVNVKAELGGCSNTCRALQVYKQVLLRDESWTQINNMPA